jgi:hemerythrin-like domain-containing protein
MDDAHDCAPQSGRAPRLIQINRRGAARCLMGLMVNPIAAWHADHVRFARLLDLLEQELTRFHAGATPDYDRMHDIVQWLREYSDTAHHPREDVAFTRMVAREPSLQLQVSRLLQEHRVIANAGQALVELLDGAAGGATMPRADIEAAADTYLVYYRTHMATEEREMLPRAEKLLGDADWAAVAAAVPEDRARSAEALRVARTLGL